MRCTLLLLVMLILVSCSTPPETIEVKALIPIPTAKTDPEDYILKASVQEFLSTSKAPTASKYEFIRTDLNHDGRRDALVLFKNPYGYWCGLHGCTMLVFKAHDENFSLVNAIQPIREPLYISEERKNGWKSLITRVSGRADKAKDVLMAFNGNQYPKTPADLPAHTILTENISAPSFREQ